MRNLTIQSVAIDNNTLTGLNDVYVFETFESLVAYLKLGLADEEE